jgi:hypothetical protein
MKGAAEGPQAQGTDLNHLESEGYADNSNHHGQAPEKISDGSGQSAEKKPDQIAKKVHRADGFSASKYIKKRVPRKGHSLKEIYF